MKISIDFDKNDKLLVLDMKPESKLADLINAIYTKYPWLKLAEYLVIEDSSTKKNLNINQLTSSLEYLFTEETPSISIKKPVSIDHPEENLSFIACRERDDNLLKAKEILSTAKLNAFTSQTVNCFSFFPSFPAEICDLFQQYTGEYQYVVVDIAKMLGYKRSDVYCDYGLYANKQNFWSLLVDFFDTKFGVSQADDGHISLSIDVTKYEHFMDNYFKFEKAIISYSNPDISHGAKNIYSKDILLSYQMILHLNFSDEVLGIFVKPYLTGSGTFNKDFKFIDCSNLYIPKHKHKLPSSDKQLKISIAKYVLQTMIQGNLREQPDLQGIKPIEFKSLHYCNILARNYFLENQAGNKWNKAHTLIEILDHSLSNEKDSKVTRATIISLLEENEDWFRLQNRDSLKSAILQHFEKQQVQNAHRTIFG